VSKQVQKYKGLLDMIDGGGAGAVGNKFEGGGLFSLLANALGATPYGSEDRMRDAMQAQRPVSRPSTMQAMDTMSSPLRPQGRPEGALGPFGGAGANVSGAAAERGMGLDPFGGPGDFNPANAAPVQSDSFSYSGDRNDGMMGLVPTPGRYDFVNDLPDDANDFRTNPNPFAGSPGVGGNGRSLDGQILRNAPAGLSDAPSQDAVPFFPKLSGEQIAQKFGDDMVRVYGIDTANSIMSSPSAQGIYLHYINNGYQLPEL
jgi:hypothetical protein